jgi:hypothetical protein
MVPEAIFVDEVLERNVVIGHLYEEREALRRRVQELERTLRDAIVLKDASKLEAEVASSQDARTRRDQSDTNRKDVQIFEALNKQPCYASVEGESTLEKYRIMEFKALFDSYIAPIDGWLAKEEAELLYQLAKSINAGCIVEVGSYRGRSTVALAFGAIAGGEAPVFAIDPHEKFIGLHGGEFGPIDRGYFMQKMLELRLYHRVRLINASVESLAGLWPIPIGLLWIDGDHRYEAVARDFGHWRHSLAPNALVVFDDARLPSSGPGRVIKNIIESGDFSFVKSIGKLVCLRNGGLDL